MFDKKAKEKRDLELMRKSANQIIKSDYVRGWNNALDSVTLQLIITRKYGDPKVMEGYRYGLEQALEIIKEFKQE